jgi:hypothetical protein
MDTLHINIHNLMLGISIGRATVARGLPSAACTQGLSNGFSGTFAS